MNPYETKLSDVRQDGDCALEFVDVNHSFDSNQVLSDIGFEVKVGEFVSIVGPSGSGKSTLLRLAAGLIKPSAGELIAFGSQVAQPDGSRLLVPQRETLFTWRTVQKNIEFGVERKGLSRRQRREIAASMMSTVGLTCSPDAYPTSLSGGMRQRCQLARALASEPDLLLLDEPLSSLDWQARRELQDVILDSVAHQTILMVTHDIDEATYLSDRVIVLAGSPGKVAGIVRSTLNRDARRRYGAEVDSMRAAILRHFEGSTA